jgi:ribosomal protein L9
VVGDHGICRFLDGFGKIFLFLRDLCFWKDRSERVGEKKRKEEKRKEEKEKEKEKRKRKDTFLRDVEISLEKVSMAPFRGEKWCPECDSTAQNAQAGI